MNTYALLFPELGMNHPHRQKWPLLLWILISTLGCASDYNLKIDTVSGALDKLYINEVYFSTDYCGMLLNSNEAYQEDPGSLLSAIYERPMECREGQASGNDCTWQKLPQVLPSYDISIQTEDLDTTPFYYRLIQNDGSLDSQILLGVLGIEIEVGGYFELKATKKYVGFVTENNALDIAIELFLEHNESSSEQAFVISNQQILWETVILHPFYSGESLDNTVVIEEIRYRKDDTPIETTILYPCLQPFGEGASTN